MADPPQDLTVVAVEVADGLDALQADLAAYWGHPLAPDLGRLADRLRAAAAEHPRAA